MESKYHILSRRITMMRFVVALLSLTVVVPAIGKTNKTIYPDPCSQVWSAVKDTIGVAENYTIVKSDDAQMSAFYDVKHAAHVTITGALTQRTNSVLLVPKDTGCEMRVDSNYSGFEHNDSGDFKKRVDESLVKLKAAKPPEATKPVDTSK
jgi:hypothetical protein